MKQETITKIVRATIAEYLNQTDKNIVTHPSPAEKYFVWLDLTFRREEALKISAQRIRKTWDLNEINLKNGQTLGEYLRDCHVGDIWKTGTEWLECSGIY